MLSVGSFVPEKGFHDLIDAFNQLSVRYPHLLTEKWKLVICRQG
ncbi:MAG: hypothetical protein E3K32_12555 [wastewater metagenome]|nr:hypothetical protein [Candidatus Loosdrechtia aerotolerans]